MRNQGDGHMRKPSGHGRRRVLAGVTVILVAAAVSGTVAWLSAANSRTNAFVYGEACPEVVETFDGAVKSNVHVENRAESGASIPIFVRARIDVYEQAASNGQGGAAEILPDTPQEGTDYTLTWGRAVVEGDAPTRQQLKDGCWFRGSDGYFYWSKQVAAGASTKNLIDSCTSAMKAPEAELACDVSVQGIQVEPVTAVSDSWGVVRVDNGLLVPVSATVNDVASSNGGDAR